MSRALYREEGTYSGVLQKEMTSRETFCRGEGILRTFSQPGDSMVITRYGRNSTLQVFYRREMVYWRCIVSCCGGVLFVDKKTTCSRHVAVRRSGSPFSETGSSFISAVDWDISLKFGTQTDFHLLKRMQSLVLNTEVSFGLCGRHLEKSILCHNSAGDLRLRQNLACWCKFTCRWLHMGQNWNKR